MSIDKLVLELTLEEVKVLDRLVSDALFSDTVLDSSPTESMLQDGTVVFKRNDQINAAYSVRNKLDELIPIERINR